MTIGGWITMVLSLTVVWFGAGWCFYRVLAKQKPPAS